VITGGAATTFSITYGFHANIGGQLVEIGVDSGASQISTSMNLIQAGMGVNESGQITGAANAIGYNHPHAYITNSNGNIIKDLGTLGGSNSYGSAINNLGQVTGYSQTIDGMTHAFVTTVEGQMIDLGTLDGSQSIGLSINTAGQVVGYSGSHAFVTENGLMQDLNTLLAANSLGWELTEAKGINDIGQITGSGIINGATHAYLLTPMSAVPIPEAIWLFSSGLGFLSLTRIKQNNKNKSY
jgi:probable HAF family extracellular repeat protein